MWNIPPRQLSNKICIMILKRRVTPETKMDAIPIIGYGSVFCDAKDRFFIFRRDDMETRLSIVGIFISDRGSVQQVNETLHLYGEWIIGRMGLPNTYHDTSVITIILDAPGDVTSAISGKLGRIPGVNSKSMQSKQKEK